MDFIDCEEPLVISAEYKYTVESTGATFNVRNAKPLLNEICMSFGRVEYNITQLNPKIFWLQEDIVERKF